MRRSAWRFWAVLSLKDTRGILAQKINHCIYIGIGCNKFDSSLWILLGGCISNYYLLTISDDDERHVGIKGVCKY